MEQGVVGAVVGIVLCGSLRDQLQAALAVAGVAVGTLVHTDIGLGLTVHEVQPVAALHAFHCLQLYIHSSGGILGGIQTVGNGLRLGSAVEVQHGTQLVHNHLVGGVHSGSGDHIAALFLFRKLHGGKPGGELAHIHGIRLQIGGVGHAEGGIGAVGAQIIGIFAVLSGMDQGPVGAVVGIVLCGSLGDQLQAALAVAGVAIGTLVHTDIGLGIAVHEVQAVATLHTFHFLQHHIHSDCGILGGIQTEGNRLRLGSAVKIQHRTGLIHDHLVGSARNGGIHICNTSGGIGGIGGRLSGIGCLGAVALDHIGHLTAGGKLDGAIIIGDGALYGDGVAHSQTGQAAALDTVAHDGLALSAGNLDGKGSILILRGIGLLDADDLAGELCIIHQRLAGSQPIGILHDLQGILGSIGAVDGVVDHLRTDELALALVVFDVALNDDIVANANLADTAATHIAGADGLTVLQLDGDGNVIVVGIVGVVHLRDGALDPCLIAELVAAIQILGILPDLSQIGDDGGRCLVLHRDQLTAGSKLDGAVVVGDVAFNGDDVVDIDGGGQLALDAVAHDRLAAAAVHLDGDGDILVLIGIGLLHGGDLAGQRCQIGQSLTLTQRVSFVHDLLRILGTYGYFAIALDDFDQLTAGIELDGAVVILDDAVNSDGIAHQQGIGTLALQTVAHNGLVRHVTYLNGNGDVLEGGIIGGVDGGDDTLQSNFLIHGLAGLQLVRRIDDLAVVHRQGDHMIPRSAGAVACSIGNGSGEHIGSLFRNILVHIDGDHVAFTGYDLYQILSNIHRPNDLIPFRTYHNRGNAGKISGCLQRSLLINGADILDGVLQTVGIHNRLGGCAGGLGGGHGAGLIVLITARQHRKQHGAHQNPRNILFHSGLLFVNYSTTVMLSGEKTLI